MQLRGAWGGTGLFRPDALTGTHTRDNAILYRRGCPAPDDGTVELVNMHDVAPTVLAALGIPAPGLDGVPVLQGPERLTRLSPGRQAAGCCDPYPHQAWECP